MGSVGLLTPHSIVVIVVIVVTVVIVVIVVIVVAIVPCRRRDVIASSHARWKEMENSLGSSGPLQWVRKMRMMRLSLLLACLIDSDFNCPILCSSISVKSTPPST